MTAPDAPSLSARLAACQEQYHLHFAGLPRLTRDPAWLASLVVDGEEVVAEAREPSLLAAALAHVEVLQAELRAVGEEQASAGPAGCQVAQALWRVALCMHAYGRHFAGQIRPSRQLGLLAELRASLGQEARVLQEVAPQQVTQVDELSAMLAREAQKIAHSRLQGAPAARAAMLAQAANTLMATYRAQVVGRRTLACRPELVERLAGDMRELVAALAALPEDDPALPPAFHAEVTATLGGHADGWRHEAVALRQARGRAAAGDLEGAVDAELDALLGAYNDLCEPSAEPRRPQLAPLCDRAHELVMLLAARAPQAPAAGAGDGPAALALRVARDALAMLCERYDAAGP